MDLVLSGAEQRRLGTAVRVLMGGLDRPLEIWRGEVLRSLAGLFDGSMGGFVLAADDGRPYSLHNLPDVFAREYFEHFQGMDVSVATLEEQGGGIWTTRSLSASTGLSVEEGYRGSEAYRAFYSRYGIEDAIGVAILAPEAARLADAPPPPSPLRVPVVLTCFHHVFGTPNFGERGVALFRLLLPALEAGIAARVRLNWMGRLLRDTLDLVDEGVLVADADGRVLHTNVALQEILAGDVEAERLRWALEVARRGVAELFMERAAEESADIRHASTEVRTEAARYRVRGHLLEQPSGDPAIVVSVQRLTPEAPTPEELRARWGLSPQESRVALLLARGLSNAAIAGELGLKPTTTRHYTETVYLKLQVRSRAEAARRVMAE
jgi:DNA-binding CsgD family transcriptional regulator